MEASQERFYPQNRERARKSVSASGGTISRILYPRRDGNHSSGFRLSPKFMRSTRKLGRAILPPCAHGDASLFDLAPRGVCRAGPSPDRWCALTAPFHPYLRAVACPGRYVFCGTFRPLRAPGLRGTLPCGVRTFLSREPEAIARPSALQTLSLYPAIGSHRSAFRRSHRLASSAGSGASNATVSPVAGCGRLILAACRK